MDRMYIGTATPNQRDFNEGVLPRAPELEPHHQIQFSFKPLKSLSGRGVLTLCSGYSPHILSPEWSEFTLKKSDPSIIYLHYYNKSTPTHGRAKAGRLTRTYIQQLYEDTGCSPEDLPEAMNDREKWLERVRDIRATSMTWWWWWL